jgi:putative phosphoribosyl transferase
MFADRAEAGARLADVLRSAVPFGHPIVLALPRGGVPVAAPVAEALAAPLDVLVVRKLGSPANPEYAVGAIGPAGSRVRDGDEPGLDRVERAEAAERDRRERLYRAGRPPLDLTGRTAVLVDDGIATGRSARVAAIASRALGATRVVLAAPVAPAGIGERLGDAVDDLVVVLTPPDFWAVGQYYRDFRQVTDAEVVAALGPTSSR